MVILSKVTFLLLLILLLLAIILLLLIILPFLITFISALFMLHILTLLRHDILYTYAEFVSLLNRSRGLIRGGYVLGAHYTPLNGNHPSDSTEAMPLLL